MPFNPKSLENLRPRRGPQWTPEQAKEMHARGLEKRLLNKEKKEKLKETYELWNKLKLEGKIPNSIEVMEMAMTEALASQNLEDAAKYAQMVAPYRAPKLAVIEQNITADIKSISDDELHKLILAEGLKVPTQQLLEDTSNDDPQP